MTGLWVMMDKAVGLADVIVNVGAPLVALLVAVKFYTQRKSVMWRGLAVLCALIVVSGVVTEVMEWTTPRYVDGLMESGVPHAQVSLELMKRQLPLVVLSLTAGLWLVGVVIHVVTHSVGRKLG